jgi:hypothetical protein
LGLRARARRQNQLPVVSHCVRDMAKFGLLILRNGQRDGKQLICRAVKR